MPTYKITDKTTGKSIRITGDSPPTEQEIKEIFSSVKKSETKSLEVPEWGREHPTLYGIAGAAYETAKPLVEAAGLIGGGLVGTPAGPAGQVGGAALGYAGAKRVTSAAGQALGVEEPETVGEAFEHTGEDIRTGAAMEMIGQIPGGAFREGAKAVKWLKGKIGIPAVTKKGIEKEAAKRFIDLKTKAESNIQVQKNIKAAKELEKKIPGLKLSYGQITNDADAIALERSLARTGGASLSQQQRAVANKTLENYYAGKITGAGKPEEFLKTLGKEKGVLEIAKKETQQAVDTEVMRISRHLGEQEVGKNIYGTLAKSKKLMEKEVSTLFEKIPNLKVNPAPLQTKIQQVMSEVLKGEPREDIPIAAINLIKQYINPSGKAIKNIDIKTARGLNRTLNNMIEKAYSGIKPNRVLGRRLEILKSGIKEAYDLTSKEGGQEGIDILMKANAKRTLMGDLFEKGTVADILARGSRGEETKIALANIANKFDSLGGIDDFVKAVGDRNIVKNSMRDYYQFDFLNKTRTPEGGIATNKGTQWLYKNSGKLKKLGLFDEFKDMVTKGRNLQVAEKNLDIFNKSIANKVLNADVDDLVRTAFRGSKNYGATAREILLKTKGNKAAEEGFKKAFANNLMKEAETTAPEFFQAVRAETPSEIEFVKSVAKLTNNLKKYSPAIRVIYKDEPQKIKAIHDVWNAYQTLARTAKSPIGGGSDTVENMFNILVGAGGARAGRFYLIKSIRDAFSKFSERHINEYMRRMMFDPEYAANFISIVKKPTPEKIKVLDRLITMAAYGIEKERPKQNKE